MTRGGPLLNNIRTLIIGVDDIDVDRLRGCLADTSRCRFDVGAARTLAAAKMDAIVKSPDVIVCAWDLPDGTGIDVIKAFADIPVVVTSDRECLSRAIKAFKAGAADFIDWLEPECGRLPAILVEAIETRKKSRNVNCDDFDMQRFKMIAKQLPLIIWSTDKSLRLNFILSRDVISKPDKNWMPDDFLSGYELKKSVNDIHVSALTGDITVFETESNVGPLEIRIEPFRERSGGIVGTFGFAFNIASRKLIENQLRMAKISAEAANHAKTMFLANVSHELRTPMCGILGYLDMMFSTGLSEEQTDYSNVIRDCAVRLGDIIDSMLIYSDIDTGKISFDKKEFLISDVVDDCKKFMSAYNKVGVGTFIEAGEELKIPVVGDRSKIFRIIANLLSNAFKFTEEGKVGLKVSMVNDSKGMVVANFEVVDTGIGIDGARIDEIYKYFHQLDPSSTRKYGGMGLGLTIAKRLASSMGGEISVVSELGKGSTFIISLRLKIAGVQEKLDFEYIENSVEGDVK